MTPRDNFIHLKMHFERLETYVISWNKFRETPVHFTPTKP
jgi:hypothetical protein